MKHITKRNSQITKLVRSYNSKNNYMTNSSRFFQKSHSNRRKKFSHNKMNQKARHNSKHKYLDKISVGNQCEPCWSSSLEIISQDNSKEENFFLSSPFFPSESDRNSFSTSSSKIAGKYQFETKKSYLESGSFVVPHPAKAYKGGEDAHFISENVIGVADGVGGWADSGVDPALYANKLMEGSLNAVHANCLDPVKILNYAYEYSKDIVGSSTACIIVVDEYKLRAANLGKFLQNCPILLPIIFFILLILLRARLENFFSLTSYF